MPTSIIVSIAASAIGEAIAGAVMFGTVMSSAAAWSAAFAAIEYGTAFLVGAAMNSALGGGNKGNANTQAPSFTAAQQQRTHVIRSAVANRQIIYGRAMVSGPLVFADTSDASRNKLHLVIPLAGHECAAIEEIYLNDVALGSLDASGYPTSGVYAGNRGPVNSEMEYFSVAGGGAVTVAHAADLTEATVVIYTNGLAPDGVEAWSGMMDVSPGPPAAANEYARSGGTYTFHASLTARVQVNYKWRAATVASGPVRVIAHLGAADQAADAVLMAAFPGKWTADHRLRGVCYLHAVLTWSREKFPTGIPNVKALVRGRLVEDPRTATTTWTDNAALCLRDYLRGAHGLGCAADELNDATWIAAANVCDEAVALAAGGTEARYTANGVLDSGAPIRRNAEDLLSAMHGTITRPSGVYELRAGAYEPPTWDLTEDDLAGPIKVRPRPARQEVFNAVRGTFADPSRHWQATDFPVVKNGSYATEDGGEIWQDVALPMTRSSATAQRLVRLKLEKSRQGITAEALWKPRVFPVKLMDNVRLTIGPLGWTAKEFLVTAWTRDGSGAIRLALQEESAAAYAWSAEETLADPAPDTDLPDLFDIEEPTNFRLASGDPVAEIRDDGTVSLRVRASWDAAVSAFVTGGRVELQWKPSTESDWGPAAVMAGDLTSAILEPITAAVRYDVRIRFVAALTAAGVPGNWVTITGYAGYPKEAPPQDVTAFTAQALPSGLTLFRWRAPTDSDLAGAEIRYNPADAADPLDWASAAVVTRTTRGTQITTGIVPPGAWMTLIKAVDTSGNFSASAAAAAVTVAAANAIVMQRYEPDFWETGTLASCLVHGPTRDLVAMSQDTAQDAGWATFEEAVPNPYATASYTSPEFDLGMAGAVRAYCPVSSYLLPGAAGVASPDVALRAEDDGGAEALGWQVWDTGYLTARFVQFRLTLDAAEGLVAVSGMQPTADAEYRVEVGSATVAAGGGVVPFQRRFWRAPEVVVGLSGTTAGSASATALTGTGFTGHRFDTAGADVGGAIAYTARGVST